MNKPKMMRKRYLAASSLIISLYLPFAAATTEVEFSGTLVSLPCKITTESQSQLVDFGPITSKTFIKNKRSAGKSFFITLTECDLSIGNSVVLKFTGTEDLDQPGLFAVAEADRGIAIVLEDEHGNQIKPGEPAPSLTLVAGETNLGYVAFISALNFNAVMAGDFSASVNFSVEYQ